LGLRSARDVAPDDVAPVHALLPTFLDHPLRLGRHEVEQWVAAHVHETVRREQRFDLLLRSAAEERKLVADRRILGARAGTPRRRGGAGVELSVHDDQASPRSEDPDPLVDRRLRVREGPEQMTADDEVKAGRPERELLGVGLLEPHRGDTAFLRLAPCLGDHRRREVDADDVMPAARELEGEESGAAAGVERVEPASGGKDQIEDTIPGGALGGRADAVAKVLVEVRRPPIPVGGDLLLDDVSHYTFSYARLSHLGGGRLAYTVSPSTCTSYVGTSAATGPLSGLPVRTSNCAKWSGHSMMCPSSVPLERGACRWPQESKSP